MSGIDHWNATGANNAHVDEADAIPIGSGATARELRRAIQEICAILKSAQNTAGLAFNTVAGVRSLTANTPGAMVWLVRFTNDLYFYQHDAADSSTADNGASVLVDTAGRRWVRSSGAIDISSGAANADAGNIASAFAESEAAASDAESLKDTLWARIDSDDLGCAGRRSERKHSPKRRDWRMLLSLAFDGAKRHRHYC